MNNYKFVLQLSRTFNTSLFHQSSQRYFAKGYNQRKKNQHPTPDILEQKKLFQSDLVQFSIANKQFIIDSNTQLANDELKINAYIQEIQKYPVQKLLSVIQRSLFEVYRKGDKNQNKNPEFKKLMQAFLALIQKYQQLITHTDATATLRMIKTIDQLGHKKVVQKLETIIMTALQEQLTDNTRNIERVKEIFKIPYPLLHQNMFKLIIDNFASLDSIFHLQFLMTLIKELKITDQIKLIKEQKDVEDQVVQYIIKVVNNQELIEKIIQSHKTSKIKMLALLCKFKYLDYGSIDIYSPEMLKSHEDQAKAIYMIQKSLQEDVQYERVLFTQFNELQSIIFFLQNSVIPNVRPDQIYLDAFKNCCDKITLSELSQLNPNILGMTIKTVDNNQMDYDAVKRVITREDVNMDLLKEFVKMIELKIEKQVSRLSHLALIQYSNMTMLVYKKYPDIINREFIFLTYESAIKPRVSLYLMKSEDPIFILELLSIKGEVKNYLEFWDQASGCILKMKRDLSFEQMIKASEILIKINQTTPDFWEEIEKYVLNNSSQLRNMEVQYLIRIIIAFDNARKRNDTFGKVFSQLLLERSSEIQLSEYLNVLNAFAYNSPLMSQALFEDFELKHLSKAKKLNDLNLNQKQENQLQNILFKYKMLRHENYRDWFPKYHHR
ncbi:UNKNOWN [Stylonychia lemnae]|uniref:Uncharacterized protein n=1 Tax=Stylonychia lemnae TaxID=5949 RepID=A0A078B123_STYLE|nr:UNKNOWN [Stylonychia lemnae]|eukprot:CDW86793.1 UNKNOWN [Stylonychia lemnae]